MPAVDEWARNNTGLGDPARDWIPATKSDGTDETFVCRAIYVETAGAIKVTTAAGTDRTINVPANFVIPLRVTRVWTTGTTVTGTIHLIV